MRIFSKETVSTVLIIGMTFLPACGGDSHEVKVSSKSPKRVSSQIEKKFATASLAVPQATITKDLDPKVFVLKLNAMRRIAGIDFLKKTAFTKAYNSFLASKIVIGSVASVSHVLGASSHSDAWWHGVSICEQGGRNDSFFGYFSLMDGSAGGGKSWSTQVQMANGIISRYGDHAWASRCVNAGYSASPSG